MRPRPRLHDAAPHQSRPAWQPLPAPTLTSSAMPAAANSSLLENSPAILSRFASAPWNTPTLAALEHSVTSSRSIAQLKALELPPAARVSLKSNAVLQDLPPISPNGLMLQADARSVESPQVSHQQSLQQISTAPRVSRCPVFNLSPTHSSRNSLQAPNPEPEMPTSAPDIPGKYLVKDEHGDITEETVIYTGVKLVKLLFYFQIFQQN